MERFEMVQNRQDMEKTLEFLMSKAKEYGLTTPRKAPHDLKLLNYECNRLARRIETHEQRITTK